MVWTKVAGIAASMVLAALIELPVMAAPAHADCGDPGQPACTGPMPTVEQVVAVLDAMTDPNIPAATKTDIVTPGFTAQEAQRIDEQLTWYNATGRGGGSSVNPMQPGTSGMTH